MENPMHVYTKHQKFPLFVRHPAASNFLRAVTQTQCGTLPCSLFEHLPPLLDPGAKRATGPLVWGRVGFLPLDPGAKRASDPLVRSEVRCGHTLRHTLSGVATLP